MAFTWVGDLSTDLDKVRFHIQDTVENSGPKPAKTAAATNFTDAELNGLISLEGSWDRAVAVALDALATIWARYADISVGPRQQALSKVADSFREQAKQWRADHGIRAGCAAAGIIRVDGYSDDVASDDVDAASEYAPTAIIYWEYLL